MLIKFKAKVVLTSEEEMEAESKYDLGDIAKSKEMVWRMVAIPVEEIYKITEYSKTKSIVQTYDDEKILVNESFDDLYQRWDETKMMEWATGEIEPETEIEEEE